MFEENLNQPNQVTDFQLTFSYWYVTHKLLLRRLLIIFLILLSAVLFSFSAYMAVDILVVQDQSFKQALNDLTSNKINYSYFHQKNKPADISILEVGSMKNTTDGYDFVVKVKNPNSSWLAKSVAVQLVSASGEMVEKKTFIYPGAEKYVFFFNQSGFTPAATQARLGEVSWFKHYNFYDFAASRLNFEISDKIFKPANQSEIKGNLPVSSLTFKIKNATAYSYWQVGVYMVLRTSQQVGGVNYLALDQFKSGEARTVEMRWYENLPPIYSIEIIPEVDILDPAVYMPVD